MGLCYSGTAVAGASQRYQYSLGLSGNSAQSKKRERQRGREDKTLLGLRNSIKANLRVCHDITVIWAKTELVTRKHGG